jgi:hypothetical protein
MAMASRHSTLSPVPAHPENPSISSSWTVRCLSRFVATPILFTHRLDFITPLTQPRITNKQDGYTATREIRESPDPRVAKVLVIAMTASAIRGDREKCLEAGMNNYLAKPVRAETLKQMLESYLHQESAPIVTLQAEADDLVDSVVASNHTTNSTDQPPSSASSTPTPPAKSPASSSSSPLRRPNPLPHQQQNIPTTTTEIHLTPAELARKPQAQAQMRAQMRAVEQQIRDSQTQQANEIVAKALSVKADDPPLVDNDGADDGTHGVGPAKIEDRDKIVRKVDSTTLTNSSTSSSTSLSSGGGANGNTNPSSVNGTAARASHGKKHPSR